MKHEVDFMECKRPAGCDEKNGFLSYLKEEDADIICLQETKIQDGQVDLQPEDYHVYWNYAVKKDIPAQLFF